MAEAPGVGPTAQADRAAEVRQYSLAVRWMKVLLPILAVILIGLIFLSGRTRDAVVVTENITNAAALGAGLKLENPRFAGATENGDPFVVTAASALPDGAAPDRVDLDQPTGELHMGSDRIITVTSKTGRLFRKSERLMLEGDVLLVTSDGYTVKTEAVDMDLDNRSAVLPKAVAATGPSGSISANSVRIESAGSGGNLIVFFTGDVRVTLNPNAE